MHFWLAFCYSCCLFSVRYRCICGRCGVSWHALYYTLKMKRKRYLIKARRSVLLRTTVGNTIPPTMSVLLHCTTWALSVDGTFDYECAPYNTTVTLTTLRSTQTFTLITGFVAILTMNQIGHAKELYCGKLPIRVKCGTVACIHFTYGLPKKHGLTEVTSDTTHRN